MVETISDSEIIQGGITLYYLAKIDDCVRNPQMVDALYTRARGYTVRWQPAEKVLCALVEFEKSSLAFVNATNSTLEVSKVPERKRSFEIKTREFKQVIGEAISESKTKVAENKPKFQTAVNQYQELLQNVSRIHHALSDKTKFVESAKDDLKALRAARLSNEPIPTEENVANIDKAIDAELSKSRRGGR